jgi:hypothetical protein
VKQKPSGLPFVDAEIFDRGAERVADAFALKRATLQP